MLNDGKCDERGIVHVPLQAAIRRRVEERSCEHVGLDKGLRAVQRNPPRVAYTHIVAHAARYRIGWLADLDTGQMADLHSVAISNRTRTRFRPNSNLSLLKWGNRREGLWRSEFYLWYATR